MDTVEEFISKVEGYLSPLGIKIYTDDIEISNIITNKFIVILESKSKIYKSGMIDQFCDTTFEITYVSNKIKPKMSTLYPLRKQIVQLLTQNDIDVDHTAFELGDDYSMIHIIIKGRVIL
jgi:hypothetical protein